jgi:hypothetical protein
MELNFDKEMDALLRQAAQQEKPVQPEVPMHLDADELAAFSRNALPVKARTRAMEHLVDCGNCRTVLSNLVFFENQEEESAAPVPLVNKIVSQASWLDNVKAFFTLPALAYGMGGLILVFGGLLVFTIIRSSQEGSSLAKIDNVTANKPFESKGVSSDNSIATVADSTVNANSSANIANPAAAANSASSGVYAPSQFGGAANAASNAGPVDMRAAESDDEPATQPALKTEIEKEAAAATRGGEREVSQPKQDYGRARNETQEQQLSRGDKDNYRSNNNIMSPDGSNNRKASPPPAPVASAGATLDRDAVRGGNDTEDKNAPSSPAKKKVKGREFHKDGAVWVDNDYRGQATVNIARESTEFKKLDDGLRKIAKELAGTVIVVWKNTAYRIQ